MLISTVPVPLIMAVGKLTGTAEAAEAVSATINNDASSRLFYYSQRDRGESSWRHRACRRYQVIVR